MQDWLNLALKFLMPPFKKENMKRFLLGLLLLHVSLFAETFALNNFHANVFSKVDKRPVDIGISLVFEGRDVNSYNYKIIDSLNVVIGSYYAEDLVTSRGKEILKSTLITYARKAYGMDIDAIYMKELVVKMNPSVKEIVDALKKEGMIGGSYPKGQQQTPNLAPPLPSKIPLPGENPINF